MKSIYLKLSPITEAEFFVTQPISLNIFKNNQHAKSNLSPLAQILSKQNYKKTNKLLQKVYSNYKIRNAIYKNFQIENNDLFEFSNSFLWPKYFIMTQYLDLLIQAFNKFLPQKIEIENTIPNLNFIWLMTAREFCKNKKICFVYKKKRNWKLFSSLKQTLANLGFRFIKNELKWTLSCLKHILFNVKKAKNVSSNSKKIRICFISDDQRYWRLKKNKIFDLQNQKLLNALKKFFNKKKSEICFISTQNREIFENSKFQQKKLFFYFTDFISLKVLMTNLFYLRNSFKGYLSLKNQLSQETIKYKSINVATIITAILKEFCFDTSLFAIANLIFAKNIILKTNPNLILLNYETGPLQRALIIEARKKGIKTIGFQHGMILENHYDYITNDYNQKSGKFNRSVPDLFLVWGSIWKTILAKKGGYPDEKIKNIGYWK